MLTKDLSRFGLNNNSIPMIKVEKLILPDTTKAVLWDMDGVLIDSLGFDLDSVNGLLRKYLGRTLPLPRRYIKSIYAYDPKTFWQMIIGRVRRDYKIKVSSRQLEQIIREYDEMRQTVGFKLCPGIAKTLAGLNRNKIKQVVVSNNPVADVKKILAKSGIGEKFDLIIGNDNQKFSKKPAPDSYLFAIRSLGSIAPECVVIEDSEIGVKAGKAAGCYTIGVATGGATTSQLQKMRPRADKIYPSLS